MLPPDATPEQLHKAAEAALQFILKASELQVWNERLEDLVKALKKVGDELNNLAFKSTAAFQKVQSQIAQNLALARGDTAGAQEIRLKQLEEDTFRRLFTGSNAVEAARAAHELVESERQKALYAEQSKNAATGERDAHKELSLALQEESQTLRDIRVQQQLIAESPFLSADAKMAALHQALVDERAELQRDIVAWQARLAAIKNDGSVEARQEIDRVIAKLHQLDAELQHNANQLKTTTFGGDLKKSLADWVNGFGTAGQQIGQTIQGTINTSLQTTNQLLIGAALRTGDWRQTLVSAEQQVLSTFLTLLEQMAIQKAAQLLHITEVTAAQKTSGATIAAAHAPAAAATSISSYGAAAVIGEALAAAAIAAIIALLSGGLAAGGRVPGAPSSRDNILLPMATGEHVINARAAQWADHTLGPDFLPSLNAMRISLPGMADGGRIGAISLSALATGRQNGAGDIHIFNFTDPKKLARAYAESSANKKVIVQTMRQGGVRVRA